MTESSVINLLIADRVQDDIDHIVKTLRGEGYQLELIQADQTEKIRGAIDYQPLDLILLRLAEESPSIAELRLMVVEAKQDIPIIVVMDDECRQRHKPARLLEEGADDFFNLDDADHLVAVVRKELRHLQGRKREQSFETRFKESESRSQALLENIQEAIAYIHEGVHSYANPAYLNLFGYARKEDLAQIQLVHMVPPTYRDALKSVLRRSIRSGKAIEAVELVGVRSNGQTFPMLLECAPTRMNDEPCTQIIVRDATPEKSVYNQQLENLLKYDDTTGLYSRRFFLETLEIDHDGTVLYILFTDYAAIRHAMGFEAIEQFMLEVTGLFKELLALEDIAANFASGVFTIYVPTRSPSDPMALAEKIRVAIAEHSFQINGKLFTTTCCVGVCQAQDSHESAVQILAHADRACESARQKGGNRVEVYKPPKEERQGGGGAISEQDEASIRMIRNALTKGRLSLLYQPIVSFENAHEARYKVYLQLLDDTEKPQPFDKLGAVAVRYGLMGALDKWTLIRALSALIELNKAKAKLPILFVRLSRNSLADPEFFDWFSKRCKDSRLSGHHLVLEIKETNADDCFDETRQLRARLRELGCGLALSHFGGKAHSDRLLRELVPDYIKLDGSLIERLAKAKDENSRLAMAGLAEQAHGLKIRVVAAGVSTAPQMASIWQFGVTLVQGNMVAETSPQLDFDFRQYSG
ncbi:MAG: EAL domain-containing protein [Candidatus Competibacter sp.]|nr:EAL domain-containing protein [Candidatus Competibacter sp.]MDG4584891.1 EAL domain-containing protein [Candidatus Competibacter sp.]